jgi:cytochrome d ubiquinol oxidase subunit II
MLFLVTVILAVSFVLYTVLGGADFGAGIIEVFAGRRGQGMISRALAPVWEANHVWLILAIVILFTAFPQVYSSLSTVLHIPLMLALIGIIFRGTAFSFRHYDVYEGKAHPYYTSLFRLSSFITPFFLGIILGAMIFGQITFQTNAGFYAVYMKPWLNPFCVTMGLFSTSLFAYIAAVFITAEMRKLADQTKYRRLAWRWLWATIFFGFLVFTTAELQGHRLLREFLHSPVSITCLILASLLIPVIRRALTTASMTRLRLLTGLQVTCILTGWFFIQYPVLIRVKEGPDLTVFNTQAPQATLLQLLIALLVGLALIVPAFFYLFGVFKAKKEAAVTASSNGNQSPS